MSKYKGLFTFDEDNHKYIPIAQADGIIDTMDYGPDSKPAEPLIKDEKTCKIFRDWCVANGLDDGKFRYYKNGILRSTIDDDFSIWFGRLVLHVRLREGTEYTLAELCGEEKNERAEV